MIRNTTTTVICSLVLSTSLSIQAEPVDQASYIEASEFQLERKEHVWTDGSRYQGEWLKDQPHGYGTLTYATGAQYWGRFEHGRRHGQGMMKYENGDEFEGSWHKDQPHGQGIKRYAAGSVYEGEFKDGQQNGEGKQTYLDGTYYQGHWNQDKPHGYGKLTFISGGVYEGSFQNGRPEGKGRYLYPNGDVYFGEWHNGNQDGQGRIDFNTGGYYEGDFVEGMRHGQGVLVSALGHSYSGSFKYNEAHGEGSCRIGNKTSQCQYKRNIRVTRQPVVAKAPASKPKPNNTSAAKTVAATTVVASAAIASSTPAVKLKAKPKKPAPKAAVKPEPKAKVITVAKAPAKKKPAQPKPVQFVAKPFESTSAKTKHTKYIAAATAIPNAESAKKTETAQQDKEQFTKVLEQEKAKVKTIADLRQDKSDIFFQEDWASKDLMSVPEIAYWQKRTSLFSDAMQIVSVHGDTEIRLQIDDYEGPGDYTIAKARVASQGNKLDADRVQSGTIVIESDDNGWITGTFQFKVDDGNGNALAFNNGVFRLSSKEALPAIYH